MRFPLLIISRDQHRTLFDGRRCLVPLNEVEPHLVTNPWLVDGIDSHEFQHTTVCDFAIDDGVEKTCEWIIQANGIRGIVALHEKMVIMAARLRAAHGLPGLRLETAMLFRDKVKMKAAVRAHDVTVPNFRALDDESDLAAVDWGRGAHLIKPRRGVGSCKTHVVESLAAAREVWRRIGSPAGDYEIEEFIVGEMFHCDLVIRDGRVLHASVGRYHARPGAFAPGAIAGSYLEPDGALAQRIVAVHVRVLAALGLESGVTHLEVFQTQDDELVFCEVAARPGGGGIDRMVLRRYGVHLREAAIRIEAGLPVTIPARPEPAAEAVVWGRVGVYPDGRRSVRPSARDYAALGIVEHEHYPAAGGDHRLPRHSTDYADRFILRARSAADFQTKVAALKSAVGTALSG